VTSPGPREFAIARELDFNGEYQQLRYVEVPLSGAATAIVNKFRRVDAA